MDTPVDDHEVAKRPLYIKFFLLFAVVGLILSLAGAYITYPTSEHRSVAGAQQKLLKTETEKGKNIIEVVDSAEYKAIKNNPNYQYSVRANFWVSVVEMLITVGLVVYVYKYLRSRDVSENPVMTVALIGASGGALMAFVSVFLMSVLGFVETDALIGMQILTALFAALVSFIVGFIIYYLVARVTRWWLDRKLPTSHR